MTAVIEQPPTGAAEGSAPPAPLPARRRNRRKAATTGAWNVVALILAALLGFPIFWMLITSVKTSTEINQLVPDFWPKHFTWSGFRGVLTDPIFRDDLLNSLIITLSTVLISIVIGFFGALAIARFRFSGRKVFIVAVLIVQMIPLTALTIPMSLQLDSMHLKNTLFGVIIVYLMFTMPFTVWTLRTFIANIPRELDDAALIDGCNRWQVFYKIILPLVAPGLIATGVYGWVLAWNEFVLANTLLLDNTKQTLMVYLLQFQSTPTHGADYGGLMAAATLTALPVVVLFVIFQSRISAGLTSGAVKG
jgi:N,N'-diacetylchitobiose transport system permease protein